jgi:RNA polymerase subunit RPABC4/transcription elongation factor Spt4
MLSTEIKKKLKELKEEIVNYLLNCDNNTSNFSDMILILKVERSRIRKTIELINIEGKYKIKVDRTNKKNIIFKLILNEKN